MTVLTLPVPPSVNALYANVPGKGRVKTAAYRAWLTEAGWAVRAQRPVPIVGEYELHIEVARNKRRDLDGYLKAPSDLLVSLGIIPDDRHCVVLSARWADVTGFVVTISPASK